MDAIWSGLGIAHLVLVFAPSLTIGMAVLVLLWKLMVDKKTAQINPILFLYFVTTCACMLAPLTYGILWDISLITGISTMGNCTSYPSNVSSTLVPCIFQMLVSSLFALVALLQLVSVKWGKKVAIRETTAALCVTIIVSVAIPCAIILNEKNTSEIRGSLCVTDKKETLRITAVFISFAYILPLIVIITASILTHCKLKECIIDDQRSNVVKSVLAVNVFNILQFNIFRATAAAVFYIAVPSASQNNLMVFKIVTVLARYMADLSYPVTIGSVLIVHKSLRSVLQSCLKRMHGKCENASDK